MPYTSPYTQTIAQLMLRQGDLAAQREQSQGAARAQTVESLANLAGTAITNYQRDRELAPQRQIQALQFNEQKRKLELSTAIQSAMDRNSADPLKAADDLEQQGHPTAAKALRDEHQKSLDADTQSASSRIAALKQPVAQLDELAQTVKANPQLFPQFRSKMIETAHTFDPSGALEKAIPQQYDPAQFETFTQLTGTAIDQTEKAHAAQLALEQAQTAQAKGEAAIPEHLKATGTLLSSAHSAEDWNAAKDYLRSNGVPDAILSKAGEWGDGASERAQRMAIAPKDLAELDLKKQEAAAKGHSVGEPNSLADATARYAAKKGVPVEQLTYDDIIRVKRDHSFAPPHASATGPNGQALAGNWDLTGEDFLATIPPQDRLTVKKIANYEEDPTKIASMRGDRRETIMRYVNNVNPDYNGAEFANIAPTRKAFTTGAQGKQINAINTAIGHIDQLVSLADKLQPGTLMPANKAWNAIRTTFGSDRVTNFDTLKDALSGEVAGVLSQNGATVSSIADAKAHISAASSPEQLAGYVRTQIPILGSKLASLDYQYHQAAHDENFSALSPMTKSILVKHGFNPDHPTIDQGAAAAPAAPAAAPRVGERRTINGQQAEWQTINGQRGWVAVP